MTFDVRQGAPEDWTEAQRSALMNEIAHARLGVKEACERYGLAADVIDEWLRLFRRSALFAFDEQLKQTLINQGASPETLATAEFSGTLDAISIADLIQAIQVTGKDALVSVTVDSRQSRIWFSAGVIVDAQSGRLTAEAAVYRILNFQQGRVVVELRSTARVRAIHASTHGLLLEAARRKDESVLLWQKIGDEARCYRRSPQAMAKQTSLSPAERSLLALVDGTRSLADVQQQSELGDFETLTILTRLIDGKYLVEVRAPNPPLRSLVPTYMGIPNSAVRTLVLRRATLPPPPSTHRWDWTALASICLLSAALWFWSGAEQSRPPQKVATALKAASKPVPQYSAPEIAKLPTSVPVPAPTEIRLAPEPAPVRGAVALRREKPLRRGQPSSQLNPVAATPPAPDSLQRATESRDGFESSLLVLTLDEDEEPHPEMPISGTHPEIQIDY